MPERANYRTRGLTAPFQTREAEDGYHIEGYFAVFNSIYEIFPGATESIAPGAFSQTLGNDIRALIDHETRLVLGRNKWIAQYASKCTSAHKHGIWQYSGSGKVRGVAEKVDLDVAYKDYPRIIRRAKLNKLEG